MSPAPLNVFSYSLDLAAVVAALREVADEVQVEGSDDAWTQLFVYGPASKSPRLKLTFNHDPDYYAEPNGSQQRRGMVGYFARFPETPNTTAAMQAIRSFRAAFALPDNDLDIESDDPRLEWLAAMAESLNGIIFTPGALFTANGRLILSATGDIDPEAVVPVYPALEAGDKSDAADDVAMNDDDKEEDDEDEEIPPPGARRVAERACVLTCLANRGLIEQELADDQAINDTVEGMVKWLKELEAFDEGEPDECETLQRRAGKLEAQATISAVWRVEGLAVLLWALGLSEQPRYDELATPSDLFDTIKLFDPEAKQIIAQSELRSTEELEAYREHARMTHWRLREFSLRPQAMDFAAFSKDCWFGAFDTSLFTLVDNDLALRGVPIAQAAPDLINECSSIAHERHLAINWLCGNSLVYSQTDTGT